MSLRLSDEQAAREPKDPDEHESGFGRSIRVCRHRAQGGPCTDRQHGPLGNPHASVPSRLTNQTDRTVATSRLLIPGKGGQCPAILAGPNCDERHDPIRSTDIDIGRAGQPTSPHHGFTAPSVHDQEHWRRPSCDRKRRLKGRRTVARTANPLFSKDHQRSVMVGVVAYRLRDREHQLAVARGAAGRDRRASRARHRGVPRGSGG